MLSDSYENMGMISRTQNIAVVVVGLFLLIDVEMVGQDFSSMMILTSKEHTLKYTQVNY